MPRTQFTDSSVFKHVRQIPRPISSYDGHIKSFGGEMLTHASDGALVGAGIGLMVGLILSLMLATRFLVITDFEFVFPNIFIYAVIILGGALLGAASGVLVGIGTPKFNPYPQQGLVKRWKTIIFRKRNRERHLYVPELRNIEQISHNR